MHHITNQQKVKEFQRACDQMCEGQFYYVYHNAIAPGITLKPEHAKEWNLRQALLLEEVEELKKACEAKDTIEILDALVDILYVAYGTANFIGLSNLEFTDFDFKQNDYDHYTYNLSSTDLINIEDITYLDTQDMKGVIRTTLILARKLGFVSVLQEAFDRVHASNMTKVVNGKVIKDANGKVMKPESYICVNLEDLAIAGRDNLLISELESVSSHIPMIGSQNRSTWITYASIRQSIADNIYKFLLENSYRGSVNITLDELHEDL